MEDDNTIQNGRQQKQFKMEEEEIIMEDNLNNLKWKTTTKKVNQYNPIWLWHRSG